MKAVIRKFFIVVVLFFASFSLFANPAATTPKEMVLSTLTGTSYGWDVCFIKVIGVNYSEAVQNLWENSGIPAEQRMNYRLENVRVEKGTSWGIILVGQPYLTVSADLVKIQ